jgi:hypothetical protein
MPSDAYIQQQIVDALKTTLATSPSSIVAKSSNYQSFRLHTGTALHETGDTFDFAVLPDGDLQQFESR